MVELEFSGLSTDKDITEGVTLNCIKRILDSNITETVTIHLSIDSAKAVLDHLQRVLIETV